jgi:hypothetical protein
VAHGVFKASFKKKTDLSDLGGQQKAALDRRDRLV